MSNVRVLEFNCRISGIVCQKIICNNKVTQIYSQIYAARSQKSSSNSLLGQVFSELDKEPKVKATKYNSWFILTISWWALIHICLRETSQDPWLDCSLWDTPANQTNVQGFEISQAWHAGLKPGCASMASFVFLASSGLCGATANCEVDEEEDQHLPTLASWFVASVTLVSTGGGTYWSFSPRCPHYMREALQWHWVLVQMKAIGQAGLSSCSTIQ